MADKYIPTGLRADEFRTRLEDKNKLSSKGSLYAGTGNFEQINEKNCYETVATPAPTETGSVLTYSNSGETGLEWKGILDVVNDAGAVAKAVQADGATNAMYAEFATRDGFGHNIDETYYKKTDTVANAVNAEEAAHAINADNAANATNAEKTDISNSTWQTNAVVDLKFDENSFYQLIAVDEEDGKAMIYPFFFYAPPSNVIIGSYFEIASTVTIQEDNGTNKLTGFTEYKLFGMKALPPSGSVGATSLVVAKAVYKKSGTDFVVDSAKNLPFIYRKIR